MTSVLSVRGESHLIQVTSNFIVSQNSSSTFTSKVKMFNHAENAFPNVGELLRKLPRGAYTGCRTVLGNRWLAFDLHVERLVNSTIEIFYAAEKSEIDRHASVQNLAGLLADAARQGLKQFSDREPNQNFKITIHIVNHQQDFKPGQNEFEVEMVQEDKWYQTVWLCVSPLPKLPESVQVKVKGQPRENPVVKDTKWVVERQQYETLIQGNVNEVLLMTDEGLISEGLSSNFFVITQDNEIHTADDDFCLLGSIRDIILKESSSLKWNIVRKAPNLKQVSNWKCAFLTSTSRLVLPISEIESLHPALKGEWKFSSQDPLLNEIQQETLKRLEETSFAL